MIQPDKIIRSRRKTLSVSVDVFGQVIVRAPLRCGDERIFPSFGKKKPGFPSIDKKRWGQGLNCRRKIWTDIDFCFSEKNVPFVSIPVRESATTKKREKSFCLRKIPAQS